MKCKRTSDGRAYDHHTLQVMRQQAVRAVREGQTVQSVADAFGVNPRSVFRWLADFAAGGERALLAKPVPGRRPTLGPEEMAELARAVREHTPQHFGFDSGLWTLRLIRELIGQHFGKELSSSSVHRLMKLLGFTPQRPLYQAWQQDPMQVKTWEAETYPTIHAEAKRVGATIYFADESGIRSDYHAGTTWAPQGQTPVVSNTGRRFALNLLSAVSAQGEFRFMLHEGSVDAAVFVVFLKRLMVGAEKPVFVIVDGHPIHRAKSVKTWVESLGGKLQLFHLPPYAPHLNPGETVWAHVKRKVSRQLVESKQDMKRLALGALRSLQKLPEIVKSFFLQPECRYTLLYDTIS